MRVKNYVPIARVLTAGVLWSLFMGEIALFLLWLTAYPYPSIRATGIVLSSFLGGLTLLNPHLVVKWRAGSNRSTAVVRTESLLYLAFVVLLSLGGRVPPKSAVSAILLIAGVQGIITVFIRRRNRKLRWFIIGIIYMSAITWFGAVGLFFPHLMQIADKLSFILNAVFLPIAVLIETEPWQSAYDRTPGSNARSPGETILTSPLGWPTYVSTRRRNRR